MPELPRPGPALTPPETPTARAGTQAVESHYDLDKTIMPADGPQGKPIPANGTRPKPRFFARFDAVWDSDLPLPEKMLLLLLAHYAGNNVSAFPLQSTLARRMRRSDRQIRTLLATLIDRGYVSTRRRTGRASLYRINWERLIDPASTGSPLPQPRKPASATPEVHFR